MSGSGYIGGLVGNNPHGTISDAYATGSVSGSNTIGGLVGSNTNGTITAGYWDTTTSGIASIGIGGGSTTRRHGLTTAALAAALLGGFDGSVWANGDNQTTPYLLANASFGTVGGEVYLGSDSSATPVQYGVVQTMTQLQAINSTGVSGDYVLGNDLTDSVTTGPGFTPLGNNNTAFTGVFDGLGHTLSGLYINTAEQRLCRVVRCCGQRRHRPQYRPGRRQRDGLLQRRRAGREQRRRHDQRCLCHRQRDGLCRLCRRAGRGQRQRRDQRCLCHRQRDGRRRCRRLVGSNYSGTISNAYATGSVSGRTNIGGLLGSNEGGTINNAYATGSVTGTGSNVGGLVGYNSNGGTISDTYATGSVSGDSNVGGLVGYNSNGGRISNAYAAGSVTGRYRVGGLVGSNYLGTVIDGYWDTTTSGIASTGIGGGTTTGATGLNAGQMQQQSSFAGFDFSNPVWVIYDGHTAPLLNVFLTPLTIAASNQSATYNGAGSRSAC